MEGLCGRKKENCRDLQDCVLIIHRCYIQTFSVSSAVKITENQLGHAMITNGIPLPRIRARTYTAGGKVKDSEYTEEFKELNIPILPLPENYTSENSCICFYVSLPRGGRIPPQLIAIREDWMQFQLNQ